MSIERQTAAGRQRDSAHQVFKLILVCHGLILEFLEILHFVCFFPLAAL